MNDAEREEASEVHFHPRLQTLREVSDAGNELAGFAALDYCKQHSVQAPQWVIARTSVLTQLMHLSDGRGRKRMREIIRKYLNDQMHYTRFEAVRAAKEAREQRRADLKELVKETSKSASIIRQDAQLVLDRIGSSDESIFEEVADELKGEPAGGGADAIKKSYQRVLREERDPKQSYKYYVFDPHFLDRIGAYQGPFRISQGKPPRSSRPLTS